MSAKWMGWLSENESYFGFGERKARLMMQFARENRKPPADIPSEDADRLRRKLWGSKKDSQLVQQSLSNEGVQKGLNKSREIPDIASKMVANYPFRTIFPPPKSRISGIFGFNNHINPIYDVAQNAPEIGAKRATVR